MHELLSLNRLVLFVSLMVVFKSKLHNYSVILPVRLISKSIHTQAELRVSGFSDKIRFFLIAFKHKKYTCLAIIFE